MSKLRGQANLKPSPKGKLQSVQLPKVTETVTGLLEKVYKSAPFDTDKAFNLMLILTELNPYPLTDETASKLLKYLKNPPQTAEEVIELITLLNELIRQQSVLPPDQVEILLSYIPLSLDDPQEFDVMKAKYLYLLLIRLEPYPLSIEDKDELMELLQNPSNMDRLKELLLKLRNFKDLPNYQYELIEENLPITLITSNEITELTSLTYPNGNPILTLSDRNLFFEIIGLIFTLGYKTSLELFKRATNPYDLTFNSPLMKQAHDKQQIDLEILRTKVTVAPGLAKCPRCGSKEVSFTEKQTRSSDEPMTIFYTCLSCDRHWKT